ncbi:D-glycerate dehydrogenase [Candidatus Chlorohelix sp.]|uniref:2-hydroxyacid dehydrogenase n=1 Tax=Candidatus Chlorohelix sp. TaxID=3139201 RepID=UPI00305FF4A1
MKPKVYLTRVIANEVMQRLQEATELKFWAEDRPVPREVLLKEAADCVGVLAMLTERIDAEFLDACPQLRVVSNHAVGFDNVDVAACTERGILAGNTPDVLTETTADLAFALIMATARRVHEMVEYVKQDKWRTWGPLDNLGMDVHHATLGIMGMGRIGYAVAKRAKGFDMELIYHDRFQSSIAEEKLGVKFVSREELLKRSDFITLHVPLTPETRHSVGKAEFEQMKASAILINTSRGPVVNQEALLNALKSGQIRGAGLDVTDPEPMRADNPLLELPQVTILPHIGSATLETRTKMADVAARNLVSGLLGEEMVSCLNPQARSSGRNKS